MNYYNDHPLYGANGGANGPWAYRDPNAIIDDDDENPDSDEIDYPDTPDDSDEDNNTSPDEDSDDSWIDDVENLDISDDDDNLDEDAQSDTSSLYPDDGLGGEPEMEYQTSPRGKMFYRNEVRLQRRFSVQHKCVRIYECVRNDDEEEWIFYPYWEDQDD